MSEPSLVPKDYRFTADGLPLPRCLAKDCGTSVWGGGDTCPNCGRRVPYPGEYVESGSEDQ